ncbi:hypothetical protein JW906_09245 [bacterium]|nr:hypothetical protein [bacterium]
MTPVASPIRYTRRSLLFHLFDQVFSRPSRILKKPVFVHHGNGQVPAFERTATASLCQDDDGLEGRIQVNFIEYFPLIAFEEGFVDQE